MKRRYLFLKRIAIIYFAVYFLIPVLTVFAYYPLSWDDLMYQMESRMSWKRLKMETVVQVFDPFAGTEKDDIPEHPVEITARGYKQMIHWKDGEVLVVETYSMNGQLLHLYYEYNKDLLSVSLNDKRTFEAEDIMPIQLRFRSKFGEIRSKALQEVGIVNKEIEYHVREDNHVYLRIGDLESGHYALLNPKTYDLSAVHNRIWKPDGSWLDLKIIFKNYEKYRWQTYPKVTEYFLKDQLFKRVSVSSVRTISRLPIKRLKELATKLRHKQIATLKHDYAL
ncbi:MAG: hypothetical protein QGI65_00460 [SAR324 cluster bacterium]|nr:hypothetical protein [SAR324 cluster bacterium]